MAPRYRPDPDMEYPLAYRLAQFLLQSGDALGQYGQGMRQQSTDASDLLATQERQGLARDELKRREQADLLASQDRADILSERSREADLKGRRRQATSQFVGDVGGGMTVADAIKKLGEGVGDLEPDSYKFMLEQLTRKTEKPQIKFRDPQHDIVDESGKVLTPGTPAGAKPHPPSAEASLRNAVIADLKRQGRNWQDEDVVSTEVEKRRESRELTKAQQTGMYQQIAPLMPAGQFGVPGARPGETFAGMKERLQGEVPKPEGVEERASRVYGETVKDVAVEAGELLNNPKYTQYMGSYLGAPASARLAARRIAGRQGPGVPDELVHLDSTLAAIRNRLQKALYGGRASDQDFKNTLAETPTIDDLPNEGRIKLKNTLRNLEFWERRAAEASGRPVPTAQNPAAQRRPDFRYNPATGQLEPAN